MHRSRAVGKIKKRLQEVKNQWSRLAKADFSHNESARLAVDALLDGGPEAYHAALGKEGEVDFLSSVEARYIQDNTKEPYYAQEPLGDAEPGPRASDASSGQSGTYFPVQSEGSEPAVLHTWSEAHKPYLKDKASATVYFQTDKHNNIRDLIRRCISRTSQVLLILMDVFTDTEIFCDVLEAANKRGVFVCVLLNQCGVKLFREMCEKAEILDSHLKNISIRSVEGETYCAKSGKKFSGQIQEKFIISDWRYVLSGSYSFSWLCGQVHRNFLSKFTGQPVELFEEEFRHLYASSKPVMGQRSPGLVRPLRPRGGSTFPQDSFTDSSCPSSDHTPSDPFSDPSASGDAHHRSHTVSSGTSSPSAPNPPLPRAHCFQSYVPWAPQPPKVSYQTRHYVPDGPAGLYSNLNVYRPGRLRLEDLGLGPRQALGWRPFSQLHLVSD
ncbi:protein FAM83A [Monodelphis domestica]|uniref:protein FAM83A n=1 Tax=Monodelphis domestica TaxID=13616 RepID=UPI0024E1EBCA|nr:protein FAM83A [Monodelphis domestica]